MFSENDRISQRQMERQIVLVLLCPAFWQLGGVRRIGRPARYGRDFRWIWAAGGVVHLSRALWRALLPPGKRDGKGWETPSGSDVSVLSAFLRRNTARRWRSCRRVSDSGCTAGALRTVSARGGPGLVSAVKYRKEDGWRKHSIRGLWAGF